MISTIGYNFFGDGNAIDPVSTAVDEAYPRISNGIYDQLYITRDITDTSSDKPTEWDADTLVNALFNGTLAGGNVSYITSNITAVRIKRRKLGEFDWITVYQKDISSPDELTFIINDYIAEGNTEYEYAFVPMVHETEGEYAITSVLSQFNGVFMTDGNNVFKLEADVNYGTNSAVQKRGIYEPIGRRYPVVVSNGVTNYETGSISATLLPEDYNPAVNPIPRREIVAQRKLFVDFLNNHKAKVLKDWNGNILLLQITDNPTTTYLSGSGMGLVNITAAWAQTGDATNKDDLYENGIIPTNN